MSTSNKVALSVLGGILFCVGGLAGIGAIVGDPDAKPAATAEADDQTAGIVALLATTQVSTAPETMVPETSAAVVPLAIPTTPAARPTNSSPRPRATTKTAPKPKPKPTTRKPKPRATTKPAPSGSVHPGAFCSPEGATGQTSKGTLMRCTRKAGEDRARWRKA